MGAIPSQITSLTIVFSTVYSDPAQWEHQSSATLTFVLGIHRLPVNSPHKWLVTRKKCFHLMTSSWWRTTWNLSASTSLELQALCAVCNIHFKRVPSVLELKGEVQLLFRKIEKINWRTELKKHWNLGFFKPKGCLCSVIRGSGCDWLNILVSPDV